MLRKEMRRRARRAALRSRIIAGVTAIAIGLGLAAGGTGVAFATGGPADSPCSKDDRFDGGTKYDIGTDVKSTGTLTFDWGTLTWSKKQLVFTAVPGWTVDLCVKGGSKEPNSIHMDTGSITIDRVQDISHFMWANPTSVSPKPIYEVGLYIYKKLDPKKPASWPNSGPQTFIASQPGTEWFTKFPTVLPDGVCGPGWAVQQDKVKHWGNFTWPLSITYPHDNIGWPPIYAAQHNDLETYLTVPACEPPTLPTISVVASSIDVGCDRPGSFTVGLGIGETRGEKLTWNTSLEGSHALPGTVSVNSTRTVTVTVDVLPEFEEEFGLADESLRGVQDPVTGAITFTFAFTDPGPCVDPTFDGRTATAAECDNDTPWIDYTVVVDDPDGRLTNRNARLIFEHPTNSSLDHIVELGELDANDLLEGRILWPGASVDPITNEPTGWPGWAFENGEWVETDGNFAWTRSLTSVTLEVNPTMQIAISYPPATPECVAGPVELEPVPTKLVCLTDDQAGYILPALNGVTWFVNGQQRDANTYPVLSAQTVTITFTIDPLAIGGPYTLKAGAEDEFTFVFGLGDLCDLPEFPITNAFVAFLEPTCELGQRLDVENFIVDDLELARFAPELSDLEGPDYTVVFQTTADDAVFFSSSEPVPGRTVSQDGRTLTFTGTLFGPDRTAACVTTVELKDPVSYVDTCLGASFTVYRVEGIVYTVYRNNDEPFVVPWSGSQQTATYAVNQGDSVRVVPSPASDRFTISPDPAPFERTFAVYQGDCLPTLPLTEASARLTPASCVDTTNWLTMAAEPGVQWWVNGVKAEAGTWAKQPGSFVVEATPLPGYGFPLESQTRWEFTATAVDDDCLPTLAFTGSSPLAGTIGIAGLALMVFGLGLLAWRRQQA